MNKLNVKSNTTKIFHKNTFTSYVYRIFIFYTILITHIGFDIMKYSIISNYFKQSWQLLNQKKKKKKKKSIFVNAKNLLQDRITLKLLKTRVTGKYQF